MAHSFLVDANVTQLICGIGDIADKLPENFTGSLVALNK